MECLYCKDLMGRSLEMVRLYVKNKPSKMNRGGESYTAVGWICICKRMIYGEKHPE